MILNAIAIDDEPYALKDLEFELSRLKELRMLGTFSNALQAIEFLKRNGKVNMVFCDIEMPEESGLVAAKRLSAYTDNLIFTTGHPQYALEAYQVGGDGYLMKPVSVYEVQEKIDKLKNLLHSGGVLNDAFGKIFVHDGSKKRDHMVWIQDIIEIRTYGNYLKIQNEDEIILHYGSLTKMEKELEPTGLFLRLNQSVIVAKRTIKEVTNNRVYLHSGASVSIGVTFQKKFLTFYHGHSLYRQKNG